MLGVDNRCQLDLIIIMILFNYRAPSLIKNDNLKYTTYITHTLICTWIRVCTNVQKGGESAGESEGLLVKEVSFKFHLVSNVGISWGERGRVFQEIAAKEEKSREPKVDSLFRGIWKVRNVLSHSTSQSFGDINLEPFCDGSVQMSSVLVYYNCTEYRIHLEENR